MQPHALLLLLLVETAQGAGSQAVAANSAVQRIDALSQRFRQWQRQQLAGPAPLPQGWHAAVDPRSKKTYYWNEETRVSVWQRPVPGVDGEAPATEEQESEGTAKSASELRRARSSVALASSLTRAFRDEPRTTASAPLLGAYLTSLFIAAACFL